MLITSHRSFHVYIFFLYDNVKNDLKWIIIMNVVGNIFRSKNIELVISYYFCCLLEFYIIVN